MGEITSAVGTNKPEDFIEALLGALSNIYNVEDRDTTLYQLYSTLAEQMADIDIDIEAAIHDNYVSVDITDEPITRGIEDQDRLEEEGAYEVTSIRLRPLDQLRTEVVSLQTGQTTRILSFIPTSTDKILIYALGDTTKRRVVAVTDFDLTTNTITFDVINQAGIFVIEYEETNDVIPFEETVEIDPGLFDLGYGENGFGLFGYGE